ncbi:MAG: hypothetical protein JO000_13560 [Alphaproteobacteria bacterium]|nr:hypothetical protein [Alphaproteobacteria bacterium]
MSTVFTDHVKSSVLNLAIGCFLSGQFLMLGLWFTMRGEALGAILLVVPLLVAASIGHAARIMRGVAALERSAT